MSELGFSSGQRRHPLAIIRSPRARQMRLGVDPRGGRITLTIPKRAALPPALIWAETKRSWIEAQLAKLPEPHPIMNGTTLTVAGKNLQVDWRDTYPRNPARVGTMLRVGGPEAMMGIRVIRWLEREAKLLLDQETRAFGARIGVNIGKIGVGDPVSRWGSCTQSGDIRYSWRLILAPDFVRRATVAHEVAHRVHMNHSAAFHAQVAEILGDDPAPARAWLRRHGSALHWVGR